MTRPFLRRIVVGDDGFDDARHAFDAALALRRASGAELIVVEALDLPRLRDVAGRPDQLVLDRDAYVGEATKRAQARVAERTPEDEVTPRVVVRDGNPAEVLVDVVRESESDLLVLGPHVKHSLLDFGRTARAVLSIAPTGVWVQPAAPREWKRVVAPVDLSEDSLAALGVARDLARALDVPVVALHVHVHPVFAAPPDAAGFDSPGMSTYVLEDAERAAHEEFEKAMAEFAWEGVEHESRFVAGEPVQEILEHQDEGDVIVMATHGHTGLAAMLLGGIAQRVLKRADGPVLALRSTRSEWRVRG